MAPKRLFQSALSPVQYSRRAIDVGIIQKDSLRMELGATLDAWRQLHSRLPQIIEQELKFIRDRHIKVIIGDIPPLCFEIAARASIPSVSISNFTWDVIYRSYVDEYPGFVPLIEMMTDFYGKATLALILPYACNSSMFTRKLAIPWVTRFSSLTRKKARTKFNLPEFSTIILLSFGGLGLSEFPWEQLKQQREFFFVATGGRRKLDANVLILPDAQDHFEDLVRAVDAVVTKPGYGIVADALANRLPILYTERGEFAEYPRLVEALSDCATAEFIPQRELLSGHLAHYLTQLLRKQPNWPQVHLNGAEVAAESVLSILDRLGFG
jgi:L-arabinokinase